MCPRSGQSAKVWYLCRCRRIGKSEQFRRRESRSVPKSTELRPDHIRSDTPPPCRRVEAAIARGEHCGGVSDHSNYPFDSIRYHLRVFDNVDQRVDNARHQKLSGLQRKFLEAAEFMSVTRAGEGQIQSPNVHLLNDWQDILKWYVAIMGRFRIAPTHVEAHTVWRNRFECTVDHCNDLFDEFKKFRKRLIFIGNVPLQGEVGSIDLQHKARAYNGFILDPQCVAERLEVFHAVVVILILDCRSDDARRRGIHEAFNKDIRILFEDIPEVTAFFLDRCRIDIAHLSQGHRQALVGRHPCRARSLLDPPLLELRIAFDIRARWPLPAPPKTGEPFLEIGRA